MASDYINKNNYFFRNSKNLNLKGIVSWQSIINNKIVIEK